MAGYFFQNYKDNDTVELQQLESRVDAISGDVTTLQTQVATISGDLDLVETQVVTTNMILFAVLNIGPIKYYEPSLEYHFFMPQSFPAKHYRGYR